MLFSTLVSAQIGIPTDRLNFNLNGHTLTLPYFGTWNIDSTRYDVKTAIISIHGDGQNADEHFNLLTNASNNNGLSDSTLIITPLYLFQEDIIEYGLDSTYLFWPYGDWNAGDLSRSTGTNPRPAQISSFSTLDTIYHRLVHNYPNLNLIVLTGHSAGSQMVVRYAGGGRAQQDLQIEHDIRFIYVPTNTPSFLYMDEARVVDESADIYLFTIPELCWSSNYYKYGLYQLNEYMEESGVDLIRDQYFNRNVAYLIGQYDTGGQTTNCPRDIQGDHRLLRSYIFFGYLGYYYGDAVYSTHRLAELPSVYHDFWQVVNSDCGTNTIFDLGECAQYIDGPTLYNSPPVADAGEDQIVGLQEIVVLDGSLSSDIDGSITLINWTQIHGNVVTLTEPSSLITSFTTPGQNDSLVFVLSVTDNEGLESTDTTVIRVDEFSALSSFTPKRSNIFKAFPNPFNASTTFIFQIDDADLSISIFDLQGRKVVNLTPPNPKVNTGYIHWNGLDQNSNEIKSGVYFVCFQSGINREIRKVTYLK